jgi:hypothetical protein
VVSASGSGSDMEPTETARLYYQFFNERRLDEAGQLVDPQAEFHYLPTRQRLIGRAGYRALAAMWLNGFENAELEVRALETAGPDRVDVEILGRGTHTGDLVLGESLTAPATHRTLSLPFRERLTVRRGLITLIELDFNLVEMRHLLLG